MSTEPIAGLILIVMGREDSAAAGVSRLPRRTRSEEAMMYESPGGGREGGREERG